MVFLICPISAAFDTALKASTAKIAVGTICDKYLMTDLETEKLLSNCFEKVQGRISLHSWLANHSVGLHFVTHTQPSTEVANQKRSADGQSDNEDTDNARGFSIADRH